jgi:arabinofuranan 3-O-arabinosyltransferase
MRRLRKPAMTPAGAAAMALYLGFVAIALLQQPGKTTYDTRLELTERPASFLASAFSLWQPDVNFGEVQNQANGYLFPQGPFFWLGHLLHLAPWVTQRLWTALVVIAACEGLRRVARALDLPASAAFLGGLVFALSPRLIGTSGVLTGEALPGALAPWALLPMLLAARGRLGTRPAVVLSAAAVVAMGGVNAVETGAALVPAGVLTLWAAARGLLSWRVVGGWVGTVVAATLWWTVPLLVLGFYSPPFYEYVESASTTTSLVGWSEAIRGDSHWLSWTVLPDGRPWWPAAHDLATGPVFVVVSAVVAAAGLVGLARWQSRYRIPFAFSAATGLAVLTVAHGGSAGTPLAPGARSALDGVLQIFRNVHKFDPSVRIAVAIGAAALFAELVTRLDGRTSPGTTGKWVVVPACVVLVLGGPYLLNDSRTPGWSSIPDSWGAAKGWLTDHAGAGDGGVLVLPASGFALQGWGATFDEPALALDLPHRVALTQAPLLPGPSLRFLSGVATSISAGTAGAVADDLARAGIGYVVLRGDLDRAETATPSPVLAQTALSGGGIEKVATFGADGEAPVTIYRVDRGTSGLRATPVEDVTTVAGEPESVLALQDAGLASGPVVLMGQPGWKRPVDVVTDGAQRRERQFGVLYGAHSVVLQAGEPYRAKRAVHDYPGVAGAPQVVAAYDGLASLRASSSRGYADTFGEVVTAEGPAAAIDLDPATRWVTSPATVPSEQWLRMGFTAKRPVHRVVVRPVVGDLALAPVRRIEVDAGSQHRTLRVGADGAAVVARFDGRAVDAVTVRIREAGTAANRAPVALSGIRVDDLVPRATLRVPVPLRSGTGFVFHTDPGVRPCVDATFGPDCDETRRRTPEEPAGLDRTIEVSPPYSDTVGVTGSVVARTTRRAMQLLEPVGREQRVTASSVLGNDPRVSSRFAWDASSETAWIPADDDPSPTLVFRWRTAHRISGLRVEAQDAQTAPTRALLRTAEGRQVSIALTGSAATSFPALHTRKLEVSFQRPEDGARLVVPEIELTGAAVTQLFDATAETGAVCGLGPHVVVDGVVHQSEVRGTLGDIADGRPLRLTVCDSDHPELTPRLELGPGSHRISTPPTVEFQTVNLAGTGAPATHSVSSRSVELTSSHGTRRTARVGAGAATVVWMPANANPGWRARLAGKKLDPIRVDGWQQGWIVPAGAGGRLVIDFPAQRWYGVVLAAGLVPAALVVLAALLLLGLRRRGKQMFAPRSGPGRPRTTLALSVLLFAALGVASAAGAVVARLSGRRSWPVLAGGLAVLVSGLLDARDPAFPADGIADLLAAAGFGLLFATAISDPGDEPGADPGDEP